MSSVLKDKLQAVNEYLSQSAGLFFGEMRFADLSRGLRSSAEELSYEHVIDLVERILSNELSSADLQIVVRNLTVGETYFFRDPAVFVALEEKIIPELSRKKRGQKELRIWSAGCSTGEEPYSIAISLLRTIPDLIKWDLKILATDINMQSLEKAKQAAYGSWSFRSTPDDFLETYFTNKSSEQEFTLIEQVRKMVQFGYLNLVEDRYPSSNSNTKNLDIIFCRNVLIYFTQQKCKAIADKLSNCLAPGGLLVTSASDSSRFISSPPEGLERISATMFLKKDG